MSNVNNDFYERRLRREIADIDRRIDELQQEKQALQRQMLKARREAYAIRDVTRKNSANRVMVEERILDELRTSGKPIKNEALFRAARSANFELKPNTFRTYLMRLKEKGLVQNPKRGQWQIISPKEPNA